MNKANLKSRVIALKTQHPEWGYRKIAAALGLKACALERTYRNLTRDGKVPKADQRIGMTPKPIKPIKPDWPPQTAQILHLLSQKSDLTIRRD